MATEDPVRRFRNGRNQARRLPHGRALKTDEAVVRWEGKRPLAGWEPFDAPCTDPAEHRGHCAAHLSEHRPLWPILPGTVLP